ncbi:MAG: ribonuclease P protein component 4 [Halobacteriaceae archaeon]
MTVAEDRLATLAQLAKAVAGEDEALAREYVRLARRLAERHRLDLPESLRWFTCDACDAYLRPGENARVRLQDGHVVLTCACGAHARHPYE